MGHGVNPSLMRCLARSPCSASHDQFVPRSFLVMSVLQSRDCLIDLRAVSHRERVARRSRETVIRG